MHVTLHRLKVKGPHICNCKLRKVARAKEITIGETRTFYAFSVALCFSGYFCGFEATILKKAEVISTPIYPILRLKHTLTISNRSYFKSSGVLFTTLFCGILLSALKKNSTTLKSPYMFSPPC